MTNQEISHYKEQVLIQHIAELNLRITKLEGAMDKVFEYLNDDTLDTVIQDHLKKSIERHSL